MIYDGNYVYYVSDVVQVAESRTWVSAVFESLDAAKSWAGHFVEAEEAFHAGPMDADGRRPLGMRKSGT